MMEPDRVHCFGPYAFHPRQRLLLENGQAVAVGGRALDLLQALIERAGSVVSQEALLALVWPDSVVEAGNLRVQIAALRKLLKDGQRYIINVPGQGYRFAVEPNEPAPEKPSPATSPLIGRERDLACLLRRLASHRLVTLTGPTGVGKSTLVRHAVSALGDDCRWLDFAAEHDPQQFLSALPLDRPLRVLLDHCDAQPLLSRQLAETLLADAPRVRVLAVGCQPLRLPGESRQTLLPLQVPPRTLDCVERMMDYPAVQLFVSRARARQPDFSLRPRDLPALAELCRRLDGLPLALEMAAAHIDMFALPGLQAQLDSGLALRGRRTSEERHRTLAAALDWRFERLSAFERRALLRLARFDQGFTEEQAAASLEASRQRAQATLRRLVSKSLLQRDGAEAVRYRMLNTIRSHALERSQQSLGVDQVRG